MDLSRISLNIYLSDDGVWRSKKNIDVSYPNDGNETCFAIEENSFWFEHRNNCIKTVVSMHSTPERQPIFDIGGGNGYVAKGLQEIGVPVVLVEPGAVGSQNAIKRGVKTVVQASLEEADFSLQSISSMGLFDVLEHIEDDDAFLKMLHGMLQSNGELYITVPAYWWLWSDEDVKAGHYRRYTKKRIKKLLVNCGFRVEYLSYFFMILPLPIFLLRTLPALVIGSRKASKEKLSNDHSPVGGFLQKIFNCILKLELELLQKRKRLFFGGSIVLVAVKQESQLTKFN